MVPRREKLVGQLWSANLVFAFIRVCQALVFGCACLKRKCKRTSKKCASRHPTAKNKIMYRRAGYLRAMVLMERINP